MKHNFNINEHSKVISAQYAAILLRMLANKGIKTAPITTINTMTEAELGLASSYISHHEFSQIIEFALKKTGDELLGLEFGRQLNLTSPVPVSITPSV